MTLRRRSCALGRPGAAGGHLLPWRAPYAGAAISAVHGARRPVVVPAARPVSTGCPGYARARRQTDARGSRGCCSRSRSFAGFLNTRSTRGASNRNCRKNVVWDRMESLLFPFSLGADSARHSRVLLFWSPVRSAMAACLGASGICRVCPWCAQHSLPGGKSFSMGSALIRWTALPKLGEARPAFTLRRGRARWGCVGYPAANSLVIR